MSDTPKEIQFENVTNPSALELKNIKGVQGNVESGTIKDQNNQDDLDRMVYENKDWQASIDFLQQEHGYTPEQTLNTLDGFQSPPQVETISEPTVGYRRYGGCAEKEGKWVAATLYDRKNHINYYDLPDENTANHVTKCIIPPGTKVLHGKCGSIFGHDGGGDQYFIPDGDELEWS